MAGPDADRPSSPTIGNLDTLYAMGLQVNVPPLPQSHLESTEEHGYPGAGNAPQNYTGLEGGSSMNDAAGSRRSSLDKSSPSRRSSLVGREFSSPGGESFSSQMAAEEQEARMKVEQLRANHARALMAGDEERDGLTVEQQVHKLGGGNMADMFFGGSPGMVIQDESAFPPSPYPGDAKSGPFVGEADGLSQSQIDAVQAANRNRTMTPAGPVPRPSADAQRLTLNSQGGARRAVGAGVGGDQGGIGGSGGDRRYRASLSPEQPQRGSPDRTIGGTGVASLSGMLSSSSPLQQHQQVPCILAPARFVACTTVGCVLC